MLSLDDSFRLKACEIFDVDMDSSLFSSVDMDEDYDSDETYCSQVEEQFTIERSKKCRMAFENPVTSQDIPPKELFGDRQDEAAGYEELWACLVRVNSKPTLDGFASCFKNFKRTTLIQLKLKLEEHLRDDKETSRKLKEEKEWYKHFKLTDEEKEDSLRRLRKISENYNQSLR